MTKQEQIAEFLDKNVTLPRMPVSRFGEILHPWQTKPYFVPGFSQERPTIEAAANELLGITGFGALQLGTWSKTVNGELLVEAVELVSPPFYRQDVELLVAALRYAATLQQQGKEKMASRLALGTIGVATLICLSIVARNWDSYKAA